MGVDMGTERECVVVMLYPGNMSGKSCSPFAYTAFGKLGRPVLGCVCVQCVFSDERGGRERERERERGEREREREKQRKRI